MGSAMRCRRWWAFALILPNVPIVLYAMLGYEEGGLYQLAITLLRWSGFTFLYWLPVGWLLLYPNRKPAGIFRTYLISIPLFFLCLRLSLPLIGFQLDPHGISMWSALFGASLLMFLIVLLAVSVTGLRTAWFRAALALSLLLFAAETVWPISIWLTTDNYTWPSSSPGSLNLVNVRIVDLEHGTVRDNLHLHIRDGKIVEIVSALGDQTSLPALDAARKFLMPGMIDVHAHLDTPLRSIQTQFDFPYFLEQEFSAVSDHRRAYLEAGVTAVRDCGGPANHIAAWKASIAQQKLLGPRLFTVGRLITVPDGHPVGTIWKSFPFLARQGAVLVTTPQSLIAGLNANMQAGVDAYKFIYGTIGMTQAQLSQQFLAQGVRWTNDHHAMSIVHIETNAEIRDAVNDGATGVEHVSMAGAVPADLIQQIVAHRTFVDPTFGEDVTAMQLQHISSAQISDRLNQSYAAIQAVAKAGGTLTVGTDAPLVAYGSGFLDELDHFLHAGFTPQQVLIFATRNNAAYLGQPGHLGCLDSGCEADLLLLNSNPLDGLAPLRQPAAVFRKGVLVVNHLQ